MTGVVPFIDAQPGDESWVYRCEPGDDYGWTTDPEHFDDLDDPVDIVRQRWQLVAVETVRFHPSTELCPTCGGDGEVVACADGCCHDPCPLCDGDGRHPLAGQMEILP